MRLVKIHSLHIYPVKSLAGIQVSSFEMDDFGPKGDRRWMIVDSDRNFVTQRAFPELAKVAASFVENGVSIHIPGEGAFTLEATDKEVRVLVWRDWVKAQEGELLASQALSRFCDVELYFVYMPDSSFRRVDAGRVTEYRRVGFADGFPFLITNLASLEELNGRLEVQVDMRRFRPNIVVEGSAPWEEDRWRKLEVGEQQFDIVKPSSRCVLTTVDPDIGVKDPGLQPLRTLSGYRRTADGVIFGQNAIHESPGVIHVDDSVTVIESE
ncbi:MOSC N-terminal beta barrel domain-containing protein [uncultured Marinobacter sp.]|uniref:MOSC domain-containing protein n=1 Tax=uncultured Marinobacter sp. TaxID=187379 RepID=UPI0030D848FA|tara:strand:+ start:7077 stop:7880 length:804 start_codon:yes stop_codon:yes gene_type:complete